MAIHKKTWESPCHSSNSQRIQHLLFVETNNSEAYADISINDVRCKDANNSCLQIVCQILHIHGRVALIFDKRFGTARFPMFKYKASSNAFPIYRFLSHSLHPWVWASFRNDAKLQKKSHINKWNSFVFHNSQNTTNKKTQKENFRTSSLRHPKKT